MRKKFLEKTTMKLIAIFFGISFSIIANTNYYPHNFKQMLRDSEASPQSLRRAIHQVISLKHIVSNRGEEDTLAEKCSGTKTSCYGHTDLGYTLARTYLFGMLHIRQDNQGYYINDKYCHIAFDENVGVAPKTIPNHQKINCEHTWPQSKFNKGMPKSIQKSDLHHLFPTDSIANGTRGNFRFGEAPKSSPLRNCPESRIGRIKGKVYFEPPKDHKGNVARALFYFAVRYNMPISDTEEAFLRKWHNEDPVDQEELQRNSMIHNVQGNRNPFVDYPTLVSQITNF